jgi:predicted amidohydrolase
LLPFRIPRWCGGPGVEPEGLVRTFRVALAQISPKLGDTAANLSLHLDAAKEAKRAGADLVMFPELSLTGYLLRDQAPEVALRVDSAPFARLERASREIDLLFGFVEEAPGHRYHNTAAYLSCGRVLHVHRKIYLPTYGMFDEGRDFAPGEQLRSFDAPFGPAGILVCEDCWHPMCAWLLAQEGAEVLLVLSSGPTRGARPKRGITSLEVWHSLLRATAQFQTSFVVYVNRVGYEDGLNFGGGSIAVDPFGRVVAALPALETGLAVAELEEEVLRRARTAYPLLRDEKLDLVHREIDRIRNLRFGLPDETERKPTERLPAPLKLQPRRRSPR